MTSSLVVFYLTYLFLWKTAQTTALNFSMSVHQMSSFVSVKSGDRVTLPCFNTVDSSAKLYWYKQTLGQKPKLISTFYFFNEKDIFYGEFKNNSRFKLNNDNANSHLTISNLRTSDSATYYCMRCFLISLEISETITVSVKGSDLNIPVLVHQSDSETIQPGGSVTLNCMVQTGTCDGEHSVYWFKDSGEPHPGIIYTHGDRNNQCERKPDTQTHSCVYNLPMKNLTHSHAGTYYCAVASCGHILFGNVTRLKFEDNVVSLVLVYFLSGALTFTTILVVLLTFLLYKRNSCQSTEYQASFLALTTTNTEVYQDDSLHYAALSANLPNRSRRQSNTLSECVYSSVKQ